MRSISIISFIAGVCFFGASTPAIALDIEANGARLVQRRGRTEYFLESFEECFLPVGWLAHDFGQATGDSWLRTSERRRTGFFSAAVYFNETDYQEEWLVTPAVDLTSATDADLVFYEHEKYWDQYGDTHEVKISISSQSDTASFATVLSMNPGNHAIEGFSGVPVTVDLSGYLGNATVYIAFVYKGQYADVWYIDDVSVFEQSDHDVRCLSIDYPGIYTPRDSMFYPLATVENVGLNAESFNVTFSIDSSGQTIYSSTKPVSYLNPGCSIQVAFDTWMSAAGNTYRITVFTELSGDEYTGNDTLSSYTGTYLTQRTVLLENFTAVW